MGSTGRNIPREASPTHVKANMFKMIFIFLFLTEVQICFLGLRVLELLISLRGLFCFFKYMPCDLQLSEFDLC